MARVTRQLRDLRIDELPHDPHPGDMVVVAGQQCGTGRRAGGEHVKTREPQTLPGETVERRCADLAPEGTDVTVTEVVGHDEQDIGHRRRIDRRRSVRVPGACG
jgi:hypothetical protein